MTTVFPLYHSNLGVALRELGRTDEAIAAFRRAVELDPGFSGGHFNLGLALERDGLDDLAILSLQKAVETNRRFADASLALGRVLMANDRPEEALDWLERAMSFVPNHADLHFSIGNALTALDRLQQAVESFQTATRLKPDAPELHNNLGVAFQQLERWGDAEESFKRALAIDPHNIDASYNLAGLRERKEDGDTALTDLRRILELQPDNVDVLTTLGLCLEKRERFEEAAQCLESAATLAPERVDILCSLGRIAANDDPAAGQAWCERALQIDADNTAAWNTLGNIHEGQSQHAEAEDCFRSALTIDPEDAIACYNLGNLYKDQWRLEDALDHYDRAIELKPDFQQAHLNRGVVLKYEGRLEDAVEAYSQPLAFDPDNVELRFHRSLARLMQGDFARGWDEYETRWDYDAEPRDFRQSVWDGTSLRDRTLLVYGEQGIGDEILFAACLPEVVSQTRGCVVECDARLVPIFSRSFPLATIVAKGDTEPDTQSLIDGCDVQIAAGSLPRYYRREASDFPHRRRFLAADPGLTRRWRVRLDQLGPGLKIGISWRGGNKPTIQRRRSTRLDDWRPLLELPGVHFVNLQYGDCRPELDDLRDRTGVVIHHWDDVNPLKDMNGFAAQIAALDLVISIDNSTVHMAGALGVPVFTLLPFAPELALATGA